VLHLHCLHHHHPLPRPHLLPHLDLHPHHQPGHRRGDRPLRLGRLHPGHLANRTAPLVLGGRFDPAAAQPHLPAPPPLTPADLQRQGAAIHSKMVQIAPRQGDKVGVHLHPVHPRPLAGEIHLHRSPPQVHLVPHPASPTWLVRSTTVATWAGCGKRSNERSDVTAYRSASRRRSRASVAGSQEMYTTRAGGVASSASSASAATPPLGGFSTTRSAGSRSGSSASTVPSRNSAPGTWAARAAATASASSSTPTTRAPARASRRACNPTPQ